MILRPSPLNKYNCKVVAARSWGEVQVQCHQIGQKPTIELSAMAPTSIQAIRKLRQLMDYRLKELQEPDHGNV